MSGNPPAMRLRDLLGIEPEPLRERLKPGERILYTRRLAPVPPPQGGVVGDLAAALAIIPDRKSLLTREAGR